MKQKLYTICAHKTRKKTCNLSMNQGSKGGGKGG